MDYHKYIASQSWKEKRRQRLEIDGHKCVVCKSDQRLEVHHLTYENLGNEDVLHDLVTACHDCHPLFDTIERYQRYKRRQHTIGLVKVQERKVADNGLGNSAVQIDFHSTAIDAQRADREPAQQVGKEDEASYIKAREDRR